MAQVPGGCQREPIPDNRLSCAGSGGPELDPRVLVVENLPELQELMSVIIRRQGYCCDVAASLQQARSTLLVQSYDIIFLDLRLSDGSGMSILEEERVVPSQTLLLITTADCRLETAVRAIRQGAYDIITKPFTVSELCERLEKAVGEWRSRSRYRFYQKQMERMVSEQTEALQKNSQEIERIYDETVFALGAALDLRDPETEEHCRRVARNSVLLGKELGFSKEELRNLKWGAYLHDIGKIGIPQHILSKASELIPQEMDIVKSHPIMGYSMISNIDFLKSATDVVLYHHEKYDGSGYPYGLKGEEIPAAARIFAVMDAFDAMTFDRPYRKALPFSDFVEEISRQSGKHFDPDITAKFLQISEQAWRLDKARENVKQQKGIVDAVESSRTVRR